MSWLLTATLKPASWIVVCAASLSCPSTFGTLACEGWRATTSATLEPLSTFVSAAGVWLSTVPGSARSSSFCVTVAVSPIAASAVRASASDLPVRLGTDTCSLPEEITSVTADPFCTVVLAGGEVRSAMPLAIVSEATSLSFTFSPSFARRRWASSPCSPSTVGMVTVPGPSATSVAGLLKHLALVEDSWFTHRFAGEAEPEPWASVDWDADPDWDFHSAAADPLDDLVELYRRACERSRAVAARHALDDVGVDTSRYEFTLRFILVHLLEETARHLGHLDILIELLTGTTGE